jgi:hypothetical protein
MPAMPTGTKYEWQPLSLARKSVVERNEMERGLAKQRRTNSDTVVSVELVLHFDSKAEAAAFETWFDVTIKGGQDYFDFVHPITGATVLARVVGGELGGLTPMTRTFARSKRSMRIEWTQAAL